MSKIGRKPISIQNVQVEVKDNRVYIKGKGEEIVHELPPLLAIEFLDSDRIKLVSKEDSRKAYSLWGLHRALLANKITGITQGFAQDIKITGLGYKAQLSGNKVIFSLGYSHKIDLELPKNIAIELDKSGQNITVKGSDKELVGKVSSKIRSLRPPEPYKGTGIKLKDEIIIRKAGKSKAT